MSRINGHQDGSSSVEDQLVGLIRKSDLNLLTALYILIEERSVTKAAQRMLISQSAMSRVLDRLQTTFEDDLLVRTARSYEPTQRASAIHAQLKEMLPQLAALFVKRELRFDPARASCLFRIEAGDFGTALLIPGLVAILGKRAPGIRIDVVPRRLGFESLEDNSVDLVFATGFAKDQYLRSELLFKSRFVCLMRTGHPLSKGQLTLRRYASADHILLSPLAGSQRPQMVLMQERRQLIMRTLERMGRKLNVRVRVPYSVPLGLFVESTDLIATITLEAARCLKTANTRIVPAPKELGRVDYHQVWHSRNDLNVVHRWMRGLIRALARHVLADLSKFPDMKGGRILGVGVTHISDRRVEDLIRLVEGQTASG